MRRSDYVVIIELSFKRNDCSNILKALFLLRCQDGFKLVQRCLQLPNGGTGSFGCQLSAFRHSERLRSHLVLELILSNLWFES